MPNEPMLDYATPFPPPKRKGWKVALWIGGVLFCFACLISILLPSLGRAREPANQIKCGSNLGQIGKALLLYSNDSPGGVYPRGFAELLLTQDITPEVFVCLSSNATKFDVSNPPTTTEVAQLSDPAYCSYISCFDGLNAQCAADDVLALEPLANHAGAGGNVLYRDGHVEWLGDPKVVTQLLADAAAGVRPVRVKLLPVK